MAISRWRQAAINVIHETLKSLPPDTPRKDKQKALAEVYPFGERRYTPYKIWLEEVRRAIGPSDKKVKADENAVSLWNQKVKGK